jgi:hypothetical protein
MTSGGGKDDDLLASDPELADLVRTLRSYGVLTRAELLEHSGARNWSDQGFNAALRQGIAQGNIKELSWTRAGSIPPEIHRPTRRAMTRPHPELGDPPMSSRWARRWPRPR